MRVQRYVIIVCELPCLGHATIQVPWRTLIVGYWLCETVTILVVAACGGKISVEQLRNLTRMEAVSHPTRIANVSSAVLQACGGDVELLVNRVG